MQIKKHIRDKILLLNKRLKGPRAFLKRRCLTNTTVIGITGSCGKTSTTHFLHQILSQQGTCSLGIDYNTSKDIIKNLLKTERSDHFHVQEISGHAPGIIDSIIRIIAPDISVVTTVGQDHYKSFRTLDAVAAEKGTLIKHVKPRGTAVLNIDDPYVAAMADKTKSRVLTFGVSENADVHASAISASWPDLLSMTVSYKGESIDVQTGLFGRLWVTSLLGAIAAALAAGVSLVKCAHSLQNIAPFDKRQSLHKLPSGAWVVSDCFKATYWSVLPIVQMLSDVEATRITLIIGSFSDTPGSTSPKCRKIAVEGLKVADRVIFVGVTALYVKKIISPENKGRLFAFDSVQDAANFIASDTIPDEVVFIKSGKKEHLERIYHSQSNVWCCWKYPCKYTHDCLECHENGLDRT